MDEIVFSHGWGLGDAFIHNGIVNTYSNFFEQIHLACHIENLPTLECLYKDNHKVKLFKCNDPVYSMGEHMRQYAKENNITQIFNRSMNRNDYYRPTMEKDFYSYYNLDFSLRYLQFKLPQNIPNQEKLYNQLIKQKPYCLINQWCSEGKINYSVNNNLSQVYLEPGHTNNMLEYMKIIREADEIHCIDTSWYHLIESINIKANLFFHPLRHNAYKNKDMLINISDKWNLVKYD